MRHLVLSFWLSIAGMAAVPLSEVRGADFLVGGSIFSDCANPLTRGVGGVSVTVDGTEGTFTFTSANYTGTWGGVVPEGTYTVTAALPDWCFCRTPFPIVPGVNCPPSSCENPFGITVDTAHEQENQNLLFHATECVCGDGTCVFPDCASNDYDGDSDVDLRDVAAFQRCFTGSGPSAAPGCEVFDTDCDEDVDLSDYAALHDVLTGPW